MPGETVRLSNISFNAFQDLQRISGEPPATPFRHVMRTTLDSAVQSTVASVNRLARPKLAVRVAYNMKTSPLGPVLTEVRRAGFLVGCTNRSEVDSARRVGFPSDEIVLYGPAKSWPETVRATNVCFVSCDSLEELSVTVELAGRGHEVPAYVGVHLRLAEYESRLGVPIWYQQQFDALCDLLLKLPECQKTGLHFRAASSKIGQDRWVWMAHQVIELAAMIQERTGRHFSCLCFGGGWYADDWPVALSGPLVEVTDRIAERLPEVELLILEAGKALAQQAVSLVSRVLAVRKSPLAEIVVDASIAELPDITMFPHHIAWRSSQDLVWRTLTRSGDGLILGRLFLESDILARRVLIPEVMQPGDLIAFCDAGAYDTSMSFSLGDGEVVLDPSHAATNAPSPSPPPSKGWNWFGIRQK